MKCLNELVCTMFLDNELEPGERQRAAAHLEQCPRCRERIEKMAEENRALTAVFDSKEEAPDLVSTVMDKLTPPVSSMHFRRWAIAAAIVVAGFLSFFLWFAGPSADPGEMEPETRVIVCNARVEGHDVENHIFDTSDPEITFIWFEKQ